MLEDRGGDERQEDAQSSVGSSSRVALKGLTAAADTHTAG